MSFTLAPPSRRRAELNCLDENQLVAFFSPGRTPAFTAAVEAHAAKCQACRHLLARYVEISVENGTAQTYSAPEQSGLESAVAPSLTPSTDVPSEKNELALRLAYAQAKAHIGKVLKGKWQIDELLGFGGMAYVFGARHRNGRRVAIKCMRPELALEPLLVERFLREGYVANKIEHPGAVAILDDDVMEDGTPFLVMERLSGQTLRQRLESGPLQLQEALSVLGDVLDVLVEAHDKGIIHRDLKPDNLFQTDDGTIKVLDFGIARLYERTRSEHETRSGTTMGTVGFMPPEQARGLTSEVDARSDVWALGATLFTLLTGSPVQRAPTPNQALLLAMTTPVPPMRELRPWLPRSVSELLDCALAFDKKDRYRNARAMKEALDAVRSELARARMRQAPTIGGELLSSHTEVAPALVSPTIMARALARRGTASPNTAPSSRIKPWAIGFAVTGVLGIVAIVGLGSAPSVREARAVPMPDSTAEPLARRGMGAATLPSAATSTEPVTGSTPTSSASPVASGAPRSAPPAAGKASASPPSPLTHGHEVRASKAPAAVSSPVAAATSAAATAPSRDPLGARH